MSSMMQKLKCIDIFLLCLNSFRYFPFARIYRAYMKAYIAFFSKISSYVLDYHKYEVNECCFIGLSSLTVFTCCNAKRFPSLGTNSRRVDPKSTSQLTKLYDQHAHALEIEHLMVNLTFQLLLDQKRRYIRET